MFAAIRMARLRHVVVALVLAVPTVVFFAPTLIAGNAPGGFDLNYQSSPWRDEPVRPIDPQSRVQIDQAEQLPWVDAAWDSLRSGRVPMWTPAVGGGTSLGTNPVFATYSVFTVAGQLVAGVADPAVGLAVRVLLAVAVGELFAFLFLRRLGLSTGAALFGAVAYVFSGAVVAFETRNAIPLLLPAMLWCVDRLAERADPSRVVVAAVGVLVLWLEGFPAMMVHVLAVAGVWWLVRTAERFGWRWWRGPARADWFRAAGAFAGAMVLGAVLTAFSSVPFALQLGYNDVFAGRNDPVEALGHSSIWWLLDERALGSPAQGPWYTGLNPIEGLAAVGTLVMVLAVAGVVAHARRPGHRTTVRHAWAAIVGVLVVAVYLGGPLLDVLASLPGFSGNPFSRIRFVAVFGLVVLAAFGLDDLLVRWRRGDRAEGSGWPGVAVAVVFLGCLAAPFVTTLGEYLAVKRSAVGPAVNSWRSEVALLVGALAVGGAATWFTRRLPGRWATWRRIALGSFAAAVAFAQVGLNLTRLTPQVDRAFYAPETAGHDELRDLTTPPAGEGSTFRFIGDGMGTFAPNSAMTDDLVDARSHSFRDPEWKALILSVFPGALALDPLKVNVDFHGDVRWESPVFDDMSLGVLALSSSEPPLGDRHTAPAPTDWSEVSTPGTIASSGPVGPYVGVDLHLRADGDCSLGDVLVRARRDGEAAVVARRPVRDAIDAAADAETVPFALPMGDAEPGDASSIEVALDGAPGGCRLAVGQADGTTAMAPITRPAGAPWRMASAVGGWLYTRESAHPLVRLVSSWQPHRSRVAALAAAVDPERRSDDPLPIAYADAPGPTTTEGEVTSWSADDHGLSIVTESAGPSMLVASFNTAPGWSVTVDGRAAPIVEPDGALLGVAVPAGRHDVRFEYTPPGLWAGVALSLTAALAAAVLLAAPVLRRRRRRMSTAGAPSPPDEGAVSGVLGQ